MPSTVSASFRSLVGRSPRFLAALVPPPASRVAMLTVRVRSRLWLYALMVAVVLGYGWLASGGGLDSWPTYGWFHDLQADGFLKGQLNIAADPAPELVRAENPYDRANSQHWLLDASYHHGKYYLYWGPVPALLLAAAKALLGIHRGVGDQYIQFFHECLGFVCGALLIERLARRLFRGISKPLVALAVLVFATANPTLHAVATPSTYHTAITAAQAWLIAGLLVAFDVVWRPSDGALRVGRLLGVGTLWALALASRVTVALTIAVFVVASAWALAGSVPGRRMRRFLASGALLGAPLVIVGLALLAYNKVRFGTYLEFGTNVQLSGMPIFRVSSEYVWPNFYSYVFRPFATSCRFPYAFQVWYEGVSAYPAGTVLPAGYMVHEPTVGWFWTIPLTWLAPLALLLAPRPLVTTARRVRVYVWCGVCFLALASVTGLVGMGLYCTTMRYLGDVAYGLVLVSLLASFALLSHRFGGYAPRVVSAIVWVLGGATIAIGLALGYHGYNGMIEKNHPALDEKLVRALSVCGDLPPVAPRYLP